MSKNYMNDSQTAEIVKYISDTMKLPLIGAGGGFAPLGMYGFSCDYVLTPPQGWLFADGSIYNIADYPEYAALLASQHGRANIYGGDGVTTFATKDLRGEFIRGWGQNSHENQGDGGEVGEHQDGTEHQNYYGDNNYLASSADNIENNNSYKNPDYTKNTSGGWRITKQRDTFTDFPYAYTSRPTNTSVTFLVKVTLSDAELNAFNVYTPKEHQVAWWEEEIDGVWKRKPVYERTYKLTTFAPIDVSDLDAERIEIMSANIFQSTFSAPPYYTSSTDWWNMFVNYNDNGNTTLNIRGAGGAVTSFVKAEVTVEYTKTTDDWQTS